MYQLGFLSKRDIVIVSIFLFIVIIPDTSTLKSILNMDFNASFIAIILSPLIAVMVGEWLRIRTYNKQQRDDLVRRLIRYGYQTSLIPGAQKKDFLEALNEIKYWYSKDAPIKELTFAVMDKMQRGEYVQDSLIKLIQVVAQKEGHSLSREEVERVFTSS